MDASYLEAVNVITAYVQINFFRDPRLNIDKLSSCHPLRQIVGLYDCLMTVQLSGLTACT